MEINLLGLDIKEVLNRLKLEKKDLIYIGNGKSAHVYKINGEDKVVKVFYKNKIHELLKEKEAYKKLSGTSGFLNIYDVGKNYIVLEFFEGKSLYSFLLNGLEIPEQYMEKANEYIKYAQSLGLNPNDVHLKNILVNEKGEVKVIDLARFLDKQKDKRWDHIYFTYRKFYKRKWFPRKFNSLIMNIFILIYKISERIFK